MDKITKDGYVLYVARRGALDVCPVSLLEPVRQKKIAYAKNDDIRRELTENGSFLRAAIVDYLGGAGDAPLPIAYNCYGKPYLEGNACYFSLSHSNDLLICAIAGEEIGADAEQIRPLRFDLSGKILNEEELREYEALTDGQDDYMIRKWTEKESIGKLLGTGFRTPKEYRREDFSMESIQLDAYWITVARNNA